MRKFTSRRCFRSLTTAANAEAVGKARQNHRAGRQRIDIVSEELCEDALNLLAPSLKQYKGCRILDFSPGNSKWSKQLHNIVKPSTHALLDKQTDVYAPFWSPLLQESNSRYRHIPGDIYNILTSLEFLDDVFRDTSLPTEQASPLLTDNAGLLITANIALFSRRGARGQARVSPSLSREIWIQSNKLLDLLQDFGKAQSQAGSKAPPPRLLLWTTDDDRLHFLPRTIFARNHETLRLEESWDVVEVVGSQLARSHQDRAVADELQSAVWTAQRMRENGIQLPDHRQSNMHATVMSDLLDAHEGSVSSLQSELKELRRYWQKTSLNVLPTRQRPTRAAERIGRRKNNRLGRDGVRIKELEDKFRAIVQREAASEFQPKLQRIGLRIEALNNLERSVAREAESPSSNQLKSDMVNLTRELATTKETLSRDELSYVRHLVDNLESLYHREPPTLLWDQRPHEPLQATEDEFYPPNKKLSLISFTFKQPQQHASYIPTNRDTSTQTGASSISPTQPTTPRPLSAHPLTMALLRSRRASHSLPEALESISHGSSTELIPACPSLTDPLRGGRYDPSNFGSCLLTHEQLHELVDAWDKSPFRASEEALHQHGVVKTSVE